MRLVAAALFLNALAIAFFNGVAVADTLHLKNGNSFDGELVSRAESIIVFKVSRIGEQTFNASAVLLVVRSSNASEDVMGLVNDAIADRGDLDRDRMRLVAKVVEFYGLQSETRKLAQAVPDSDPRYAKAQYLLSILRDAKPRAPEPREQANPDTSPTSHPSARPSASSKRNPPPPRDTSPADRPNEGMTSAEMAEAVATYKPYRRAPDAISSISATYAVGVFKEVKFVGTLVKQKSPGEHLVTHRFTVGSVRDPHVIGSETLKLLRAVEDGVLDLTWIYFESTGKVRPYNSYALDAKKVYEMVAKSLSGIDLVWR
jgi:hypothetical protein